MRLVRRQSGLSFVGCMILALIAQWIVNQFHWNRLAFLPIYGLLVLALDYSIRVSTKSKEIPLRLLMLLGLPAYAVVLIAGPAVSLGIPDSGGTRSGIPGAFRHREKNPVIG